MRIGIVIIGRNEGQRLINCLESLAASNCPIVYVDSGSGDGSPQEAALRGADVVALDMAKPFTAARARNAGAARLVEAWPGLAHVQFVDGDCSVAAGWLEAAEAFLDRNPGVAVACGRVRELRPDASVYNWLCDVEWDTPVGAAQSCGGIAMMRIAAFSAAGGFREGLIAGEEPELCLRLRAAGWRIWRLDREMALHDANIHRFSQWWRRTMRGGFAFAAVVDLHARSPQAIWRKELRRALIWGLTLPIGILAAAVATPWALTLLLAYPAQMLRIAARRGLASANAWRFGFYMVAGKFAEAAGALKYFASRMRGRQSKLIEYK